MAAWDFPHPLLPLCRVAYTVASKEPAMLRRLIVLLPLFCCGVAYSAEVTDSTGR